MWGAISGPPTIMIVLLAAVVVVASLPPMLDEDRNVPGFCSPGCLLQQDAAHSTAVTPAPLRHDGSFDVLREWLSPAVVAPVRVHVASPDVPRAPPLA